MKSSRQLLLGLGVFLGGGLLLFSMAKQPDVSEDIATTDMAEPNAQNTQDKPRHVPFTTLTADIATEERILAEKHEVRELKKEDLDKRTQEFLAKQERAEALAMEKSRLENEQYRLSAIEPITDGAIVDNTEIAAKSEPKDVSSDLVATETNGTPKKEESQSEPVVAAVKPSQNIVVEPRIPPQTKTTAENKKQSYSVRRGDGLIKIAKQHNMPVAALAQANNLSIYDEVQRGQKLTIPASSQVQRLVRSYNASHPAESKPPKKDLQDQQAKEQEKAPTRKTTTAPTKQLPYTVQRGDSLIKLARQYNVPTAALAEANNLSTDKSLHVGQKLTIPSRRQIARLEREAEQKKKSKQLKRDAQSRLEEARRKAAKEGARGTFGVQVALADNQKKADEIVKKMRQAGYKASTSETSRGVRVIVGPEKGKEAALALKDKLNSDSRANVSGAWVLYWR